MRFLHAHRSEVGILTSTALLSRIIRQVTSEALLKETVYFLLGEDREPEKPATMAQYPLRHRLIEHCDHLSDEVFFTLVLSWVFVIVGAVQKVSSPQIRDCPPPLFFKDLKVLVIQIFFFR